MTLADILRDDVEIIEKFFVIPTKDSRQLVPMQLTPIQREIAQAARLYPRLIVLKSSSVGSTSFCTALGSARTFFRPNHNSVILSHKGQLSKHLFQRTTVFHNNLPRELRVPLGGDSQIEKYLPEINSKIFVGTAGSEDFGRGQPIHFLLCSEWLFYTEYQYETVVLPAIQRVPEGGQVILESTPHGENFGYELIQDSLSGRTPWKVLVFYWWQDPTNRIRATSPLLVGMPELQQFKFRLDPDEEALRDRVGLSWDQLRWRRFRLSEIGDLFYQEQLEDLSTCFLNVREMYYDRVWTQQQEQNVRPAYESVARALCWEEPQDGVVYSLGVDPGQARYTESAAWVCRYDGDSVKWVALLAGKYPPDVFGQMCMELGRAYNNALMVPEANGHGIAFLDAVKHMYPRIYLRRDIIRGIPNEQLGWLTTTATKPYMMEELNRRLKDGDMPDHETLRQIRSFRYDEKSRVVTTTLDDRHDAAALALMGLPGAGVRGRAKGSSGFTSWDR